MISVREKFLDFRYWITRKLWRGRDPDETLAKRSKIFVLVGISLIAVSKVLYLVGVTIPNIEVITPTLVVIGAFSLYTGNDRNWSWISRYFGFLALGSVFAIDVVFWGFRTIYLFTWPAFLVCWVIGLKQEFSFFDKFSDLAVSATFIGAIAILFFDVFTAFGTWAVWRPTTVSALYEVYIAQIPFTLYHLGSLIFIPPMVGLGKMMSRVKIRVPVASRASEGVKERR